MHKELKRAIFNWMLERTEKWGRVSGCIEEFAAYIYDKNGNYLIGGKDVYDFILETERLIYGKDY